MKKIFLLLLIIAPALMGHAQFEKAELQASGLTCSMCSNAIQKALKTLPFVDNIQTDLNKNLFTIGFKKNVAVDFDQIKNKVEGAGFSVANFWITTDVHNLEINNDTHALLGGMNFHFMHVKQETLDGKYRLQLIDKNFVLSKDYKKFSSYTVMPCYQTGKMQSCCTSKNGSLSGNGRIYHVTI
jgi:copper chaperone CopZ